MCSTVLPSENLNLSPVALSEKRTPTAISKSHSDIALVAA